MSNKNLKVRSPRNKSENKPATKNAFAKKDYSEKISQDSEARRAPLEKGLELYIPRTKKLATQIQEKIYEMPVKESAQLSQPAEPATHMMDISAESEIDSLKIENHLILQQLFEAQEEIERQLLSIRMDENKSGLLLERFKRLQKRYKNYIDYKHLTIISVEQSTTASVVHWKLSDVLFAGTEFDEIAFNTVLTDGQVGIYIATMTPSGSKLISFNPKAILYPTLFNSVRGQQQVLRSIQYDHWHAFGAAVAVVDLCIRTHWRDVNVTNEFDRPFWGSALSSLQSDFLQLPKVFRFERVSLKQELINSDYEHIWIEVFNINFGSATLPKFEFRISASEINSPRYSLLPKMEFPLIDGKTPPFESWYPESFDDYGSKLEIRFNLGSKKFDIGVWSSLSKEDREFLLAFFAQIPRILSAIPQSEMPKHRALEYWLQFTKEAMKILQKYVLNSMTVEMKRLHSPENNMSRPLSS